MSCNIFRASVWTARRSSVASKIRRHCFLAVSKTNKEFLVGEKVQCDVPWASIGEGVSHGELQRTRRAKRIEAFFLLTCPMLALFGPIPGVDHCKQHQRARSINHQWRMQPTHDHHPVTRKSQQECTWQEGCGCKTGPEPPPRNLEKGKGKVHDRFLKVLLRIVIWTFWISEEGAIK